MNHRIIMSFFYREFKIMGDVIVWPYDPVHDGITNELISKTRFVSEIYDRMTLYERFYNKNTIVININLDNLFLYGFAIFLRLN